MGYACIANHLIQTKRFANQKYEKMIYKQFCVEKLIVKIPLSLPRCLANPKKRRSRDAYHLILLMF